MTEQIYSFVKWSDLQHCTARRCDWLAAADAAPKLAASTAREASGPPNCGTAPLILTLISRHEAAAPLMHLETRVHWCTCMGFYVSKWLAFRGRHEHDLGNVLTDSNGVVLHSSLGRLGE